MSPKSKSSPESGQLGRALLDFFVGPSKEDQAVFWEIIQWKQIGSSGPNPGRNLPAPPQSVHFTWYQLLAQGVSPFRRTIFGAVRGTKQKPKQACVLERAKVFNCHGQITLHSHGGKFSYWIIINHAYEALTKCLAASSLPLGAA